MSRLWSALVSRVRDVWTRALRELDAQTLIFTSGLALLSIGAGMVFRPAAFFVPGGILVWMLLPARPPFVARPTDRKR